MMATAGVVPFFDTETLQQHDHQQEREREREREHYGDQDDDDNDDSIPMAIISVKHNKKDTFFVATRNDDFDDENQPPAAEDEEEAQESTYQALFAEQTALEMQEIVQYWARYIDRDHHHDRSHYDGYDHHHQYADQSICLIGNALANYYNDDHDYNDDVDDEEEEEEDIGLLAKDTATSTASSSYTAVAASVAFARNLGRGRGMATAAVKKGSSASLSSSSSSLLMGMSSRYEVVHNEDPPLLNTKHDESAAASIRILPRWRIPVRPIVLVLPEQKPPQQFGGRTRTIFRRLRFRVYCLFDYCHTRAVLSIWERPRRRHQPQQRRRNNNNNHFGVGEVPLYWLQWYLFCHLHSTPILWQVCTTMLLLTTLLALVTVALTVHVQIWRIHVWLVDHLIRSVILMWPNDDDPWTTAVCWENTSS
jgi:hypothetical protein